MDTVATIVSPTIVAEPEKTEEAAAAEGAEGAVEGSPETAVEGEAKKDDTKEGAAKASEDKTKKAPNVVNKLKTIARGVVLFAK